MNPYKRGLQNLAILKDIRTPWSYGQGDSLAYRSLDIFIDARLRNLPNTLDAERPYFTGF